MVGSAHMSEVHVATGFSYVPVICIVVSGRGEGDCDAIDDCTAPVSVAVVPALLEQAVGVTSDPEPSKGLYPRHWEY